MSALIAIVLKGSILMIAAAAAIALMYRASAATRHFVWTLSVAGLLLLQLPLPVDTLSCLPDRQ